MTVRTVLSSPGSFIYVSQDILCDLCIIQADRQVNSCRSMIRSVRQPIVFQKLQSSRHGLTLEQLADALDPIESVGEPIFAE